MTSVPDDGPWLRALDEVYETFAGERKPKLIASVPEWHDAESIGRQPLRQLAPEIINEFAFELGYTVGDEQDVRYFLPRLFELVAHGELSLLDRPWMLSRKLDVARWNTWPPREQEVVRKYMIAWFDRMISRRDHDLLDLIVDFGDVFDDPSRLLVRVEEHEDESGVLALLWLAEHEGEAWLENKRKRGDREHPQLRRWLQDPARLAQVEAVRKQLGAAADDEWHKWLFETATTWLEVCAAAPVDGT